MKNGKRTFVFLSVLTVSSSILTFLILGNFFILKADECDNIPSTADQIQSKIDCLSSKVSQLSSQAGTLKNQIAQFDAQIRLTTLKITNTKDQIELLGGRIDQLEVSLESLTQAFSSRAVETYKLSKFENNFSFVLSANDISSAVSRFHYLAKIQEQDRSLLGKLQEAQTTYKGEKTDQESLQKELSQQKKNLDSQKIAKGNLLTATKGDEKRYQQLLSDAQAQLAAFKKFVSIQGGASILNGTTKDDSGWGKYYNQRDSQWGNRSLGSSNISVADAGCLVTSMAMIITHYGKSASPGDIASNPSYFSSYYPYADLRQGSLTINGTNTDRTRVGYNQSSLDNELSSGKPVILGVSPYGSAKPEHFIVVKRKDGNDYIINDPFIENGMNIKFSSHYSISSIRTVDRITIN